MDFIFYEDFIMVKTPIQKTPDCVLETVMKRMDELEKDIKNHQDMVNKLEAEYAAHANFLLNYPFEQRNLSQGSDDKA